jgi:two-component system, response regulator
MENLHPVDILIVEDNPSDAELTIRALKKQKLANNLYVVEDGAEALDFMFCRGKYDTRHQAQPPQGHISRPEASESKRIGGVKRVKKRPCHKYAACGGCFVFKRRPRH